MARKRVKIVKTELVARIKCVDRCRVDNKRDKMKSLFVSLFEWRWMTTRKGEEVCNPFACLPDLVYTWLVCMCVNDHECLNIVWQLEHWEKEMLQKSYLLCWKIIRLNGQPEVKYVSISNWWFLHPKNVMKLCRVNTSEQLYCTSGWILWQQSITFEWPNWIIK